MGWVRISDDFYDHPAHVGLDLAAWGLWTWSLAWANRNLTDGIIPRAVVKRMDPDGATSGALIDAGRWIALDGDRIEIHDYLAFQPSAEQIKRKREKDRERWQRRTRSDSTDTPHGVEPEPEPTPPSSQPQPQRSSLREELAPAERPRDPIFDALCEVCAIDPQQLTSSARGALNKARKEIVSLGATDEDVRRKAHAYRVAYPAISLTPSALVKHWPALGSPTTVKPSAYGTPTRALLGRGVDAAPAWELDEEGLAVPASGVG